MVDNIKYVLQKFDMFVDLIQLAEDRVQWRAFVNIVTSIQFP